RTSARSALACSIPTAPCSTPASCSTGKGWRSMTGSTNRRPRRAGPALARDARGQRGRRRLSRDPTRDLSGAWRVRRGRTADRAQRYRSGAEITIERLEDFVDAACHAAAFRIEDPRARSSRSGKGGAQPRRAPGTGRALGRRLDRGAEPQPVLAPGDTAVPLAIDAVREKVVGSHPSLR